MNNKLKIISGKYKSRIIHIPNKKNLKPTKAFIRESLFNIINFNLCRVSLDLFSGSGILSIEALSRGIQQSILVEQDKELIESIKSNLITLNETNALIYNKKVGRFLKEYELKEFDIIFLDPPYDTHLLNETLIYLKEHDYLKNNKYFYFEKSKLDKNDYLKYFLDTHRIVKDLSIGDVRYTIAINKDL